MTEQLDVIIDPRKESYCFTFSKHDCYKLATGRCTFDLTEEEYEEAKTKCNSPYNYGARVSYCRELSEMMQEGGLISATKRTGIYAHRNACGHMTFSQGQHRSCIAKKNQLPELHIDRLGDNRENLCHSCYLEKDAVQMPKRFWGIFKKSKKHNISENRRIYITDDKL